MKSPLKSTILKGFFQSPARTLSGPRIKNLYRSICFCMKEKGLFSTVDEYIALHTPSVKAGLDLLRKTIKKAAAGAEEMISYEMPAYRLKGMLAFFSATEKHNGFYPTASPIIAFREKLKSYETSKGTVRFPLDKPIPAKLVTEIVKWKVSQNLAKDKMKSKKS
jgi:uncharacterized protein YdhG (YjbR/CyaY superfamily)